MKYSPGIQTLVDKAQRSEKVSRARRKRSATIAMAGRGSARVRQKDEIATERLRLQKLRYDLRKAREDLKKLRARRNRSKPLLAKQVKAFRDKWRAWVNAQVEAFRSKHRNVWDQRIHGVQAKLVEARAQVEAEREVQRAMRRLRAEQREKRRMRSPAQKRKAGAVAKQESDDLVEQNIEPELVPVWRKMKGRIRTAGTRATRTEAFLDWCHDHPEEVEAIQWEEQPSDEEFASEYEEYLRRQGAA